MLPDLSFVFGPGGGGQIFFSKENLLGENEIFFRKRKSAGEK